MGHGGGKRGPREAGRARSLATNRPGGPHRRSPDQVPPGALQLVVQVRVTDRSDHTTLASRVGVARILASSRARERRREREREREEESD